MSLIISGGSNGSLNNLALSANTGTIVDTGRAGGILQVVSAFKNDPVTTASSSFADISGLSVSLTPSSTSNKVLILVNLGCVGNISNTTLFNIVRDSTNIAQPSAGTAPATINEYQGGGSTGDTDTCSISFLDSPATTSSVTYKVQWRRDGGTSFLNRHTGNSNYTAVSNIVAMEVVA